MPTLISLESLLISALLHLVQASVCAIIFESGHEVGCYPALSLKMRMVRCSLLSEGVAERRQAARRAVADRHSSGVPVTDSEVMSVPLSGASSKLCHVMRWFGWAKPPF